MRAYIEQLIRQFIAGYPTEHAVQTTWCEPLIAFADAKDNRITQLKTVVHPDHFLPDDLLPGAQTIVSYFVPFDARIVESNIGSTESSKEWDYAYVETNAMFNELNRTVTAALRDLGYGAAAVPFERIFDKETLKGRWSHRHIAVIAGLGTFGLNNMLITDKGCCGRANSFLTDIAIEPTPSCKKENCHFKRNGTCKKCIKNCVAGALTLDGFDRFKCDAQLQRNQRTYADIGSVATCGKCLVEMPCSFANPCAVHTPSEIQYNK